MDDRQIIRNLKHPDWFHIITLSETTSTNDWLYRMAREEAPEWTVVVAEKQTSGRGRYQRTWESSPGKSLLFSLLLRPRLESSQLNLINILAAYTMAAVLENAISSHLSSAASVQLKWPNDVFYGGKKLCGILLEGNLSGDVPLFLIVGIGVNVNQTEEDFSPGLRNKAISLRMITGNVYHRELLLSEFLNQFFDNYSQYLPYRTQELLHLYLERVLYFGQPIEIETQTEKISGVFKGLTPEGYLILQTARGERVVHTGEMFKFTQNTTYSL